MANPFLIPIISRIHFDDILGQFSLKVTWEAKTPVGNFHREETVTAADLATILQAIIQLWAGGSAAGPSTELAFHVGNLEELGAFLASFEPADFGVLSLPEPISDSEPYDPAFEYDGEEDDWGETTP